MTGVNGDSSQHHAHQESTVHRAEGGAPAGWPARLWLAGAAPAHGPARLPVCHWRAGPGEAPQAARRADLELGQGLCSGKQRQGSGALSPRKRALGKGRKHQKTRRKCSWYSSPLLLTIRRQGRSAPGSAGTALAKALDMLLSRKKEQRSEPAGCAQEDTLWGRDGKHHPHPKLASALWRPVTQSVHAARTGLITPGWLSLIL